MCRNKYVCACLIFRIEEMITDWSVRPNSIANFRRWVAFFSHDCRTTNCQHVSSMMTDVFLFDLRIPQTRQEIRRLLISEEAAKRWERCASAAELCCKKDHDTHTGGEVCPTVWDAWECWQKGVEGESSTKVCPEFAYTNSGPACQHKAEKECFANGTWNPRTDYVRCSVKPRLVDRIIFHSSLLGVSAFFCLPAIIVLSAYRRLREQRFALHRNLLIAILLRNIFVIIIKSVVMMQELKVIDGDTLMVRNGFWCKFLTVMEKVTASAAFTCMLVDGLFLHRKLVLVFKPDLNIKWVYSMATGATIIPVIVWICLMATLNDSNCWLVNEVSNLQWALDAPRLTMLFVNTVLLFDILRVLFTKLRRNANDNQVSTAKATLFLMPLFGVQFLLTAWRPAPKSCDWEQAYYFLTYAVDGLQGIVVSLLYCYLNKEVRGLIQITYRKTENVVSTRFRSEANRRRATQPDLDKRRTFTTIVGEKPDGETQIDQDTINQAIAYNNTQYEARLEPQSHVSNSHFPGSDSMLYRSDSSIDDLRFLDTDNPLDDEGFFRIGFEHDVENKNVQSVNTVLTIPVFKKKDEDTDLVDYSFEHENIPTHNDIDDKKENSGVLVDDIPIPQERSTILSVDKNTYENVNFKDENTGKNYFPERFSQYSEIYSDNIENTELGVSETQIDNVSKINTESENFATQNIAIQGLEESEDEKNDNTHEKECEENCQTVQNGAILLPDDIIDNVDALEIFRASISDIVDHDQNRNINTTKNGIPVIEETYENVVMDPNKLCPNRPDEKNVVFIDI